MRAILDGILPTAPRFPTNAPERKIWNLCRDCWETVPGDRPDTLTIVHSLRVLYLKSLQVSRKTLQFIRMVILIHSYKGTVSNRTTAFYHPTNTHGQVGGPSSRPVSGYQVSDANLCSGPYQINNGEQINIMSQRTYLMLTRTRNIR